MPETDERTDAASRLLGAHMPTAGGLHKAVTDGAEIGCTALQIFTGSPRQWEHGALDPEAVERFAAARVETGISFVVSHDSYLINLAAPDAAILERSREAFRHEIERCEALDVPWVVTHMGAHLGSGEEAGIETLCRSLALVLRETEGLRAGVALETTAGQGTGLGYTFEQIARIVEGCEAHPRLGVCLDTCHVFAAGYDIRDEEGYDRTLREFDRVIGFDRLRVIHANDAKKPLGSRVDRHEHIGRGQIGMAAFGRLVNDTRLRDVPVIIETPDAETMHRVNLGRLRRLAAGGRLGMQVTVRFFGHFSDYGDDCRDVTLPAGATVADLGAALATGDERFRGVERYCRAAVNEEYVAADAPLAEGDEVAFIPPMSGG